MSKTRLTAIALLFTASGCATIDQPSDAGSQTGMISVSVGPCFGFCPVYEANVSASGTVDFRGTRHTAVLGARRLQRKPADYAALAAALKPYAPAIGTTASTQCDQRISDQQHYTIVWTAADGARTTLQHDKGCRSAQNDALNAILEQIPSKLGIADWAKQTSRPGVSRG